MKLRRMRWAGNIARMGEMRIAYGILVGKPEGKRTFGRPRLRWKDNIRIELRERECWGMWTECIWLRIGTSDGSCEHSNETS